MLLFDSSSDILAELDLTPSGIDEPQQNEQAGIRYPSLEPDASPPQALTPHESITMIKYYHYQLHLRNTLNKIQPLLYPPDGWCCPVTARGSLLTMDSLHRPA